MKFCLDQSIKYIQQEKRYNRRHSNKGLSRDVKPQMFMKQMV